MKETKNPMVWIIPLSVAIAVVFGVIAFPFIQDSVEKTPMVVEGSNPMVRFFLEVAKTAAGSVLIALFILMVVTVPICLVVYRIWLKRHEAYMEQIEDEFRHLHTTGHDRLN